MARRKADTTKPIGQVATELGTAAAAAIADGEGTTDPVANADPNAEAIPQERKRRGRPPGSGRKTAAKSEAVAAAEAQTQAMLTVAFGALGETIFHEVAKVDTPRWGNNEAVALAQVWTPVIQEKIQTSTSPETLAWYATAAIVSPFVLAAFHSLIDRRRRNVTE